MIVGFQSRRFDAVAYNPVYCRAAEELRLLICFDLVV